MNQRIFRSVAALLCLFVAGSASAYTHADTLRGSNGRGREWWDVNRYNLRVRFDMEHERISGKVEMFCKVSGTAHDSMQIDLQEPMVLDSVKADAPGVLSFQNKLAIAREGNVWWVKHPFSSLKPGTPFVMTLYYHGEPRKAVNPPWDGGFSWKRDSLDRQWVAVSCQGLGASVWWPCKDAQWEEPDGGMRITLEVPKEFDAISNGRRTLLEPMGDYRAATWDVTNPINNYDVTFYIGHYAHWSDTMMAERGQLDLDYYVLDYNEQRARAQFAVVKQMIHCFEYWMGPYPFYEDGYKLVEAPYLGMEHQSAIAYGNKYKMGYLGMDRSMTGYGQAWDYIIIHESGHEWFGNNVTAKDMADNWIHEGITSYSEALFTECQTGKEKGQKYSRGLRYNIRNEAPVVSAYGVNEEGPGDIYEKGAAVMYMIRLMTNDDEKFRQMLRGLSSRFYHSTVTTAQVEEFISKNTGLDLKTFFQQYLRTTDIPKLEYNVKDNELNFRFTNVVNGFTLPIAVTGGAKQLVINPTGEWQKVAWDGGADVKFSNDYLVKVKK